MKLPSSLLPPKTLTTARPQTIWIVVLGLLGVAGLVLLAYIRISYVRTIDQNSERLASQAGVVSTNIDHHFDGIYQALQGVRRLLPVRDAASLNNHLSTLCNAIPGIRTILVTDDSGRAIASNRSELLGSDLSFREYFKRPKSSRNPDLLFVSPPFVTMTGKNVINLSIVVPGPRGEFSGIVSASLDPRYFRALMGSILYSPDMWSALVHSEGQVFMMMPERPELDGKSLSRPGTLFTRHMTSGKRESILTGLAYLTGQKRMVALRTYRPESITTDASLVIMISRDWSAVIGQWRNESVVLGTIYLVLAPLIVLLIRKLMARRIALDTMLQFQSSILESAGEGIFGVDLSGRITFLNSAAERFTGWSMRELTTSRSLGSFYSFCCGDTPCPDGACYIKDALRNGQPRTFTDKTFKHRNGTRFDVEYTFSPLYEDNRLTGGVVVFTNVSERKKLERERRESEKRLELLAKVFQHSGEAIVITDKNNDIIAVNDAFTRFTGYGTEEILGRNPRVLQSGRESHEFYAEMWETLLSTGTWQGEIWDRRRDGSLYPKWLALSVIRSGEGDITNYIGTFIDITERKNIEQRMQHLAHHDPLTGLANRYSLKERLDHSLQQARRSGCNLAVMLIDLDHFKTINDSLGHHIGDELLAEFSSRLVSSVRAADIVARLGGDEFVVVLPSIHSSIDAVHVVKKIQEHLAVPFDVSGNVLHVSASIGISLFPHDADSETDLMKFADTAMYHAKAKGRNNYQLFTRELHQAAQERLDLETELRRAIEQDELLLYYQPQIDISTGKVLGVEALVRWNHPERGIIPPDRFIPAAEESDLILSIGTNVLELACRQLAEWQARNLPSLHMAVNLSARQFRQKELPEMISEILARNGVDPELLEVEITESAAMADPEETIVIMSRLKGLGLGISIDDFGTGYSSLSYLKLLPADRLKIDRSFVRDIHVSENDASIAATIIAIAQKLGLQVVAEGVETWDHYSFLASHNCDHAQGYLFSRPLPADQFESWLLSEQASLVLQLYRTSSGIDGALGSEPATT